ncbi:MAG: hypothetical protein AAF489_11975 [Bacteroidota bacterium]
MLFNSMIGKRYSIGLLSGFILFFWGGLFSTFGQTITKASIIQTFQHGDQVAFAIENNEIVTLNTLLGDTQDARTLISLWKKGEDSEDKYDILKDIFYHPDIQSYIFTIHYAKWIKTDSDWGLNDYLFVLQLRIDFDSETQTAKIVAHHLFQNKKDIKNWWRFLMTTYNDPKFQRNQWYQDFGLVPPPPPPPEDPNWAKG